jgi:hypothetical protein
VNQSNDSSNDPSNELPPTNHELLAWDLHIMRHRAVVDAYHKAAMEYVTASTEYLHALAQPDLEKRVQTAAAVLAANNRMAAATRSLEHEWSKHEAQFANTRDKLLGIPTCLECISQFYAALPSPALAAK